MKINREITILLTLGALLLVAFGCAGIGDKTCGTGIKSQLLKRMLNAGDDKSFNRALVDHGAVTGDELPCVLDAIESWSETKRRNGAKALALVGGDRKDLLKAQKKVVLETKDIFVWAKVFDSLFSPRANANPAELAAKRHDMIKNALVDKDGFIEGVGLKAGVLGKFPGIEAELRKRLDSLDANMLSVALDALPPETARAELPRLLKMLDDYETGTRYSDSKFKVYVFTPLLNALIRSGDPRAFAAARTALEKGYERPDQVRGTREELSQFRNTAAVLKPDESIRQFCYYLIEEKSIAAPTAVDILTTQVWLGKHEPTPQLVKICMEAIEAGNLDTVWSARVKYKPEQTSCERFFYHLETGLNPIESGGKIKHGSESVKIGRDWLKVHE